MHTQHGFTAAAASPAGFRDVPRLEDVGDAVGGEGGWLALGGDGDKKRGEGDGGG